MITGNPDICNVLDHKDDEQKKQLEVFGFPTDCPVPEGKKCFDGSKKVDVSKFKDILAMAVGTISAKYDVTHDTVNANYKPIINLFLILLMIATK